MIPSSLSCVLKGNKPFKISVYSLHYTQVYYSYPSVEEPHNNTCRWANCDTQCQDLNDLVRHVNTDHIYR